MPKILWERSLSYLLCRMCVLWYFRVALDELLGM